MPTQTKRPIIFVAHSIGGLVCENVSMLLSSAGTSLIEHAAPILALAVGWRPLRSESRTQDAFTSLYVLSSLANSEKAMLLFLSGRDSVSRDIQAKFASFGHISMACQPAQSDIATFIDRVVNSRLEDHVLTVGDQCLIDETKTSLTDGAQGM